MQNFLNYDVFSVPEVCFTLILANSADPDKMLHFISRALTVCQSTHLGVSRIQLYRRECSRSVVECLTSDRGFEPHRCRCVVSLSKNINPSLVLVQPRKTGPFITDRLLMGHKESNQTNKQLYRVKA